MPSSSKKIKWAAIYTYHDGTGGRAKGLQLISSSEKNPSEAIIKHWKSLDGSVAPNSGTWIYVEHEEL